MFKTSVFEEKKDGYNKFRIPSIICTAKGTLLAFAEGRTSIKDASENDIVMKRSENNGRTWEKIETIVSEGKDSINNPQALVIEETNRIILMYQRIPFPYHERDICEGLEGDKVAHTYIINSDDDGKTWSSPRKITPSVKRQRIVTTTASGPGIGIELKHGKYAGRLIMPFNQGPWGKWRVYAVFSDDKGENWKYGDIAIGKGNEVQMVELADGSVLLNARTYGRISLSITKNKSRMIAISRDGGKSWSKLKKDRVLVEPNCQGSIIWYNFPENNNNIGRVLFANPASKISQKNGTVRVSFDDCKTWSHSKTICPRNFAYSCLTILKNKTIGCLYETGEKNAYKRIDFANFSINWLES